MARTKNRYCTEETDTIQVTTYRTGIYIRLSKERTETWRNKSQSLETQEGLARTFAKAKGLMVAKTYTDYEYSGTKFNRPAFQEMMGDVKKGLINCILIRDLSRLGRDYIEMGRLIDKVFPFLGVRFISINDNLDTLNGLGEKKSFEVEIKNLVNDLYSKEISKKLTSYNIHQASKGYYIGTSAPYGYQLDKQEQGTRLIIDHQVKPVLDTIFRKAIEGQSMPKIAAYLNEHRIAVPLAYRETGDLYRIDCDHRLWKSGNLLRLVKMPVYRGELLQRTRSKNLLESQPIRYENAHKSYISQEDYSRILQHSRSRKSQKLSTRERTPNRYKGLIYAHGKYTQLPRYCKHFKNEDYYTFMDYIYDSDHVTKQTVYISEKALDRIISEFIQDELNRLGGIKQLTSRLRTRKEDCINTYHKQERQHQQAIMRLREEISDLYASYSLVRTEKTAYLTQKSEKEAQIGILSQEIRHCETAIGQLEEEHQKQINWIKSLTQCQGTDSLTSELLQAIIERIEVGVNKQVTITFRCQIGGVENV
ncbi:recombinase family protein [Streptococcus suis]|uniref:recombinase family protein n=1 Tax=Streptococcus suis TaxID=1307 RepID=UPI000CF52F07|nr:recombinase family protein [Streptococcus suis]MBM7280934.1 recombinase family protein [Streptococcus suis]MBO4134437.1 recombinase family protein [Streptococcus suis]RRR65070.1 recombinase [Streptococcus suis]HEM3517967.1 recombinase family protein [Streptococcus suis]HEM3519871.1 recombinase family protein [Streptococcus suis]